MAAAGSTSSSSTSMQLQPGPFISFYKNWLIKHESLLQQLESLLLSSPLVDGDGFDFHTNNRKCTEMIARVSFHYKEFYHETAKAVKEDVFPFLSPPWLTSFERSLLWIAGFKPSSLFPLLERSVGLEKLSAEQKERIEAARVETRRRERDITRDMASVQERVAEPPFSVFARKLGKVVRADDDKVELEKATEDLKVRMHVLLAEADALRQWTAGAVLEVLSPVQAVKFLAAAIRFQLQAREFGLKDDLQRERGSADAELGA